MKFSGGFFQRVLRRVSHPLVLWVEARCERCISHVAVNVNSDIHLNHRFLRDGSFVARGRCIMRGYLVYRDVAGKSGFSTLCSNEIFGFCFFPPPLMFGEELVQSRSYVVLAFAAEHLARSASALFLSEFFVVLL